MNRRIATGGPMADPGAIKRIHDRNATAVSLRPSSGKGTSITRCHVAGGLRCEITEGPWKFVADLSKNEGGQDCGPSPGVFGRGALASCLSMGIVILAAQREIPLEGVTIEVNADWDMRGMYGLAKDIPSGYTEIRVTVEIDSPAPHEVIKDLIAQAEQMSPYVDVFRRSNQFTVSLKERSK
jgi:uncharacterized OsmC-like protein